MEGYRAKRADGRVIQDPTGTEGSLRTPRGGPEWLRTQQSMEMKRIFSAVAHAGAHGRMPSRRTMAVLAKSRSTTEEKAKRQAKYRGRRQGGGMSLPYPSGYSGRQVCSGLPKGPEHFVDTRRPRTAGQRVKPGAPAASATGTPGQLAQTAPARAGGKRPPTAGSRTPVRGSSGASSTASGALQRPATASGLRDAMRQFDEANGGSPGSKPSPMIRNIQKSLRVSPSLQGSRAQSPRVASRPSSASSFRSIPTTVYSEPPGFLKGRGGGSASRPVSAVSKVSGFSDSSGGSFVVDGRPMSADAAAGRRDVGGRPPQRPLSAVPATRATLSAETAASQGDGGGFWRPQSAGRKRPTSAPAARRSGALSEHRMVERYYKGEFNDEMYPTVQDEEAIQNQKDGVRGEMARRRSARRSAQADHGPTMRAYASDSLRNLPRAGPGMLHGTLTVPPKHLGVAGTAATKWGKVQSTVTADDRAVVKVVMDPKHYEGFILDVDRGTDSDFQFVANMTTAGLHGPTIDETQAAAAEARAAAEAEAAAAAQQAKEDKFLFKKDHHGAAQAKAEEQARQSAELQEFDPEMAEKVTSVITSHHEVERRAMLTRARIQCDSEFCAAAESGNLGHMKHLLQVGLLVPGPGGKRVKASLGYVRGSDGMNALMIAAKKGHASVVRGLLEMGINPRLRNSEGLSAFQLARETLKKAQADLALGAAGAALRQRQASECVKALENRSVLECARDGDLKRLRYLVVHDGHDARALNQYGMNCLHFACLNGDLKMVQFLVKKEVDPDQPNNVSQTPMQIARLGRDENIIRALKKHVKYQISNARERAIAMRKKNAVRMQGLAVEMRQYTRGTPASVQVFRQYKHPGLGWKRKAEIAARKAEEAAERAARAQTMQKTKKVKKRTPKKAPPPRAAYGSGAPPGDMRNSRFMLHGSKTQDSGQLARTLRHPGSLSHPHLPDSATASQGRHKRRYFGSEAAAADALPEGSALRAQFEAELRAKEKVVPNIDDGRFEEWCRMRFGAIS